MNNVTDFIYKTWTSTRKTKVSPKGWIHSNAVCCVHNGESKDTRGRGGFKLDEMTGGIVYSCFNCGFKTGYTPGKTLFHKTRKLLTWMGANSNDINRMVIEALRIKDLETYVHVTPKEHEEVTFKKRELPEEAVSFLQWIAWFELKGNEDYPRGLVKAVEYSAERLGDLTKMPELYWSESKNHAMDRRVIIPFTWKGKTVGYTARTFSESIKPKYYMEVDSNYVFGIDRLIDDSEFVLVFEGPIDALLMNGLAVLSNSISAEQADIIEGLGKKVIIVPDMNSTGIPLIDAAAHYGWSVSFPEWDHDIKDAGEAVQRYGKLFTLKSIISNIATTKLKIELQKKKIHD